VAVQPDHYLALGITPDATPAEVRSAYLRIMRESHPDVRPGDRRAEESARAANAAWETLSDAARRGAYDRLRVRRPDGEVTSSARLVSSAEDEARLAAYRQRSQEFAGEFQRASVRIAVAVFGVGLLLLLAVVR
jgi:curved DNA-binding protein CbpA